MYIHGTYQSNWEEGLTDPSEAILNLDTWEITCTNNDQQDGDYYEHFIESTFDCELGEFTLVDETIDKEDRIVFVEYAREQNSAKNQLQEVLSSILGAVTSILDASLKQDGLKSEDCQHVYISQKLLGLQHSVDGIKDEDLFRVTDEVKASFSDSISKLNQVVEEFTNNASSFNNIDIS